MGKKRKAGRNAASASKNQPGEEILATTARYDQDETFADSQDEFFAGKDEILLEERPSRKRRKQIVDEDKYLEPSDEEVLGYDEEDGDENADFDSANEDRSEDEDDEDGIQGWGNTRADYYDADLIDTQADALEEEVEARRLQQKQLQSMTEADFGFDEAEWGQVNNEQEADQHAVVEKLPDIAVTEDTPAVERLKILNSRYPELEPLARDYLQLQELHESARADAIIESARTKQPSKKGNAGQDRWISSSSVAMTKWRALSTYLGSIAMYFVLLTAPASGKAKAVVPMSPSELRHHPVMQSLLRSRQSWDTVKELALSRENMYEKESVGTQEEIIAKPPPLNIMHKASEPASELPPKEEKPKKSKKRQAHIMEAPDQKQRMRKAAGGVLNELDNLIATVKGSSGLHVAALADQDDSDFGDEAALTAQEAAEKAQRKKGLRFYTSQLAQKSNKRGAASRDAGGDADLPHKERLKDRQARLMRDAEKRGGENALLEQRLDYQDEDEDEEETARVAKEIRGDGSDSEDYYQTISSKSKEKKADKAARRAANAEAAKTGGQVYVEDTVGPDGKRGITYEISKNKGLMPRRKKEVRNPRVKKRMKYDEKLKKLGSIRPVYKGGEGKGGYGGELSGIKTNIVRSVKLSSSRITDGLDLQRTKL